MRSVGSGVTARIHRLGGLVSALFLRVRPQTSHFYRFGPLPLVLCGGRISLPGRARHRIAVLFVSFVFVVSLFWLPLRPAVSYGAVVSDLPQGLNVRVVPLGAAEKFRQGFLAVPPELQVVEGLQISVFAAGLASPRMLAFGPTGDLFVSLPGAGQVVVLSDQDHDGTADRTKIFAENLDRPHGLAFDGPDLVVAENNRLLILSDRDGDLRADKIEVISADIPAGGGHWTRTVLVGSDGAYYVSVGSSCNSCEESDARRATILRIDSAGGEAKIFARGLRNSVGLTLHPQTGELWASDNGRDRLGDDLPPEEINRIVSGGDYGWPYCYGRQIPDPALGTAERCSRTIPPEVELQAHSAPLGIVFGTGLKFPSQLQQMLFVAYHGSWNRTQPTGYKLVGIPFSKGRPGGPPQDVVSGWLRSAGAWGRPVAPAVGPDGALYLSDDRAGLVYRIQGEGKVN